MTIRMPCSILDRLYIYREHNEAAVKRFLQNNLDLLPILWELPDQLHTYFSEATFCLELERTMEIQGRKLVLWIQTDQPLALALQHLDAFQTDSWHRYGQQLHDRCDLRIDQLICGR